MTRSLTAIAVLTLLVSACADDFYLTDDAGKQQGPFTFEYGQKLSIAGREYTISKIVTDDHILIEKMKTIVIPEVDFRQADPEDVINFLTEASREYDRTDIPAEMRGTSLARAFSSSDVAPPTSSADPWAMVPLSNTNHQHPITLNARFISLFDAMNIVCKLGDLQWTVLDSVVLVERKTTTSEKKKTESSQGVQENKASPPNGNLLNTASPTNAVVPSASEGHASD